MGGGAGGAGGLQTEEADGPRGTEGADGPRQRRGEDGPETGDEELPTGGDELRDGRTAATAAQKEAATMAGGR